MINVRSAPALLAAVLCPSAPYFLYYLTHIPASCLLPAVTCFDEFSAMRCRAAHC